MRLILKIECDTAAFDTGHTGDEASRILTVAAEKVKDWPGDSTFRIGLRDSKGNRVGHLKAKGSSRPVRAKTEPVETPAAPVITAVSSVLAVPTSETPPMPAPTKQLLTNKELAEKYQISLRTVSNWKRRKIIPHLRVGNVVRFDKDEVSKALERLTIRARTETR